MNTDAKIVMKIDNLISMLEKVPADKVIMVPKETVDALAELVKDDEEEEVIICPHCNRNEEECEKNAESVKNPITEWCGWGLSCDDCYYKNHPEDDEEESDEEDSDEEEETPTCGFCGLDAGHSPIEHPKWNELYFCSEKCYKDYE